MELIEGAFYILLNDMPHKRSYTNDILLLERDLMQFVNMTVFTNVSARDRRCVIMNDELNGSIRLLAVPPDCVKQEPQKWWLQYKKGDKVDLVGFVDLVGLEVLEVENIDYEGDIPIKLQYAGWVEIGPDQIRHHEDVS
jgi:hypothetical protein